jgi:hypothetical protein
VPHDVRARLVPSVAPPADVIGPPRRFTLVVCMVVAPAGARVTDGNFPPGAAVSL